MNTGPFESGLNCTLEHKNAIQLFIFWEKSSNCMISCLIPQEYGLWWTVHGSPVCSGQTKNICWPEELITS